MSYTTSEAVREMNRMDSKDTYPDEAITDAIAYAKGVIDQHTGTSWGVLAEPAAPAYDGFDCEIERIAGCQMQLRDIDGYPILFPRTITTATHETEGVLVTANWRLLPTGRIIDRDGTAPSGWITIEGTAGREDTPNTDIQWAAKTIARQHLINDNSQLPERALAQPGEFGNIPLAQPGGPERPTAFPSVNARLKKYRHRGPSVF